MIISGHPGTGTTTLIDKLGSLYSLKPEQIIKVGDLFRQNSRDKTGHDILGYYQREITEDLSIDQMQKNLLLDSNPEVVFILESRLGGFFTNEIGHPPNIVTLLLTTKEEVRFKRVFERDNPDISFEQYGKEIKQRQEKDLKQWQEAYPDLRSRASSAYHEVASSAYPQMDTNPLDNPKLYDFQIDNTNLDIDQTVEAVNSKLMELGAVEEI